MYLHSANDNNDNNNRAYESAQTDNDKRIKDGMLIYNYKDFFFRRILILFVVDESVYLMPDFTMAKF